MKRFFVAFILMIVGFSASAELIHTTIKFEDFGDVFVEYDTSNKGLVYKETSVLVCQAHLCQFYSKDCYIDVSEIYYQSRDVDNYGFNAFAYTGLMILCVGTVVVVLRKRKTNKL